MRNVFSVWRGVAAARLFGRFRLVIFGWRDHQRVRDDTGLFAHLGLDRVRHVGMIAQELLGILAALTDPLARVAEPGARLLDDAGLDAEVDQFADTADPLAIHDVEFDLAERRRHLVLHHLDPRRVADDLVALLDLTGAADLQPDRGIEFQRITAGRGFRIAEHHADLHPDLIEEHQDALALGNAAGDFAQRL